MQISITTFDLNLSGTQEGGHRKMDTEEETGLDQPFAWGTVYVLPGR